MRTETRGCPCPTPWFRSIPGRTPWCGCPIAVFHFKFFFIWCSPSTYMPNGCLGPPPLCSWLNATVKEDVRQRMRIICSWEYITIWREDQGLTLVGNEQRTFGARCILAGWIWTKNIRRAYSAFLWDEWVNQMLKLSIENGLDRNIFINYEQWLLTKIAPSEWKYTWINQ